MRNPLKPRSSIFPRKAPLGETGKLKLFGLQLIVLYLALAFLVLFPARAAASSQDPAWVEGQVVVQLTNGTDINTLNKAYGTSTIRVLSYKQVYLLAIPGGTTTSGMVNLLGLDPAVSFAEPNYQTLDTEAQQIFIYYDQGSALSNGTTSQPALEKARKQWAFSQINLLAAQKVTQGSGLKVAVLDTGVNVNHPQLQGHLLPGFNSSDLTADVTDTNGHGTFVAGVIAQTAQAASILPVKVLNSGGTGTVVDAAEGLYFASTNQKAQVVNLSLGLYQDSALMRLAVTNAQNSGSLLVASAGNGNTSGKRFPAAYPGVMGVAATDANNQKASFSNFGVDALVAAPGTGIYSYYYQGGFAYGDGTSFAAPLVAGLAAQAWSQKLDQSASSVSARIQKSCTSLTTYDPTYGTLLGSGLINNYSTVLAS